MKIKNIVAHYRSHLDELTGIWLLKGFGEKVFSGVSKAGVVFLEKELEHIYLDDIYVGVGHGEFDEHRPSGRLPGTCVAMLVAQRLRICDKAGMTPLLADVLRSDTKGKTSPTQLATLVKKMHRVKGGRDQDKTYRWVEDALNAIVFGDSDMGFDIRIAWDEFLKQDGVIGLAVKNTEKLIYDAHCRRNTKAVTELVSIGARLSGEVRYQWLGATFRMLIKDAALYLEAIQEIEAIQDTKGYSSFKIEVGETMLPAITMVSDNEHASNVARSVLAGKAEVIVIRTSWGHTIVQSNSDKSEVDLFNFAVMVRMAEYRARTRELLSQKKAEGMATTLECPEWHLAFKNILLNGSLTHPGVRPSRLSLEEVVIIAIHAFNQSARAAWMGEYQLAEKAPAAW